MKTENEILLERINELVRVMRLTSGNLRDLAISLANTSKVENNIASCHDLAERLYNATV